MSSREGEKKSIGILLLSEKRYMWIIMQKNHLFYAVEACECVHNKKIEKHFSEVHGHGAEQREKSFGHIRHDDGITYEKYSTKISNSRETLIK